jgi:hypothetical protein
MTDPFANWPPIIRSAQRSRLIFWRDAALTALMWGVMFLILYTELAFALSALNVLLGRSDAVIDAELGLFFQRMRPLMLLVGALVVMLAVATFVSISRRKDALAAPQPLPLGNDEIAAIAGLDEAAFAAAWDIKRAIVARTDGGLAVTAAPRLADTQPPIEP